MESLELALRLLSGLILVAANGFFVATEFALTRVRQFPKSDFDEHPGLRRAWKMTEELEIYLTGCQVGITFTSILLGIIVEPAVTKMLEPALRFVGIGETTSHAVGLVAGLVLINLVHTIWAEQTPTYLGIEKSKLVAKYCSIPHFWWTRAVYPLLVIGDGMAKWTLGLFGIEMSRSWTEVEQQDDSATSEPPRTRGEMMTQMGKLLRQGKLSADRREEILQAVRIEQIPVQRAMVPLDNIVAIYADEPFKKTIQKIGRSKHTRYPLVGANLEDFRGIIYLPEVFAHLDKLIDGSQTCDKIAAVPMRVQHDVSVSELIDRFQEAGQELALVFDEDSVVGLITLTDAVEIIVGQAEDPLDKLVAATTKG